MENELIKDIQNKLASIENFGFVMINDRKKTYKRFIIDDKGKHGEIINREQYLEDCIESLIGDLECLSYDIYENTQIDCDEKFENGVIGY
ncbi:hypothetical protein NIE88_12620 [Sporolactobacillus shoreicorticis]|uniref:Uncharacterized protein n=1 Tax=Sporolactobacillus shoreicorticis TaxID=1923877 RepID=A0ABW5S7Q1_9BACL|nr:hypothetical protein [Sporolactobacillus shoreicorticis]MCO7126608.1 hypothetical protein [Sporolactobacillus shoreicorticis]